MTNQTGEWVTVQEAAEILGRTENAVRLLVKRGKFDQLKKVRSQGRCHWIIHKDSINRLVNSSQAVMEAEMTHGSCGSTLTTSDPMIPLIHYEQQRKEWLSERDQLQAGLMMYRWKYEELDRQVKLLPAPVEAVSTILEQKDHALHEREARIQELEDALHKERTRSWWKRIFTRK